MKGLDKIILAIGVLALAGSGAYYATQQAASGKVATKFPTGPDYEPHSATAMQYTQAVWNDPVAQDEKELELYDIFTPPKIWWDDTAKRFIFQPPRKPPPEPPFGMNLVSIDRELYRIQLEAYFEGLSGKDTDASIQLFDNQTDTSFRGKIGDKFPEHSAEIVNFKVEKRINEEDGTIRRIPQVTVKDYASGENITLSIEERLYIPNSYYVNVATYSPYPNQSIVWRKAGESTAVGDVSFKLLDFDFDKQSATVEKTFTEDKPQITQTLTVAPSTPTVTPAKEETSNDNSSSEDKNSSELDLFF